MTNVEIVAAAGMYLRVNHRTCRAGLCKAHRYRPLRVRLKAIAVLQGKRAFEPTECGGRGGKVYETNSAIALV